MARHHDYLTAALTIATSSAIEDSQDSSDGHPEPDQLPHPTMSAAPADRTDRWATRARQRHAAIHALLAQGVAIKAICRQLDLARGTVRRFARADTVEELLTRNATGRRTSILEPFTPYLHQCWNDGCTNATALFAEITVRGYRGGQNIGRHYLRQFRATANIPQPTPKPPSVRRVAGWIMTNPPNMNETDQQKLDAPPPPAHT